jgi:succinate dehydrogenase / fumarate reductase flavoprotein subunit
VPKQKGNTRPPNQIPETERDYFLERKYPSYGNLAPRDIASRAAKEACDEGRGVGPGGLGVYLDFADAIERLGEKTIADRYGNLFQMYERITGENAYKFPMRIYPAVHYTMGGLWVDYELMTTIPGLFSDHGANRLGASALMQGLADGYFVLPYTIGNYFASTKQVKVPASDPEFKRGEEELKRRVGKLLSIEGKRSVASFHRELGKLLWDKCGMARNEKGLKEALQLIPALRQEFWENVNVRGESSELNQSLEQLCLDALTRRESCGGHFRTEFQTEEGEALRDDEHFSYVSAWEYQGPDKAPTLHKEPLVYEEVRMAQRSYK